MRHILKKSARLAWRSFVLVAGLLLLIAGIIMIVTPGPAVVFIPAGLGLLATEFNWARHILHRVRPLIDAAIDKAKRKKEAGRERRKTAESPPTATEDGDKRQPAGTPVECDASQRGRYERSPGP